MKFEEGCGFETTDCLECLQILDILIYGRRVCFRIWSSREENVLHTSVNQLLYKETIRSIYPWKVSLGLSRGMLHIAFL